MSKISQGILPVIRIDRKAGTPLHQQVYDALRAAIIRRDLRQGQRIPSTRDLALELGMSRIPVLNAYGQLLAEGYLEGRVGAGTFVSGSLPDQLTSFERLKGQLPGPSSGLRPVSRRSELFLRREEVVWLHGWGAFGLHQPALDHFPFPIWSNLVVRHSRNPRLDTLRRIHPLGSERFRDAICTYLRTARSVRCDPRQVMIVSGSQQALEISARVLLDPGNSVWVEEPGYRIGRNVFTGAGCRLIPVPVDKEGMDVSAGIKRCRSARVACVTPSHQFPLGAIMSASRRLQLLNWAQNYGSWIIEDDYDSEYRYGNLPIASLQGLDTNSRVIYIGSFSKVLFPSIRLGYIVIPPDLVDHFMAVRYAMDIFPPYLYQEVVADFINEGHFARHVRRMRLLYREQRSALVDSIRKEFGSLLEVHGAEAGMHLVVTLPDGFQDQEIAMSAAQKGLWLWPLSTSYVGKISRQGFVLGFGSATVTEIPPAVRKLRDILLEVQPKLLSRR